MNLSAALAADLAALDDALDDGTDLAQVLEGLVDNVKAAVASYLGMTMTLVAGAHELHFTVREREDATEIRASLQIPLGFGAGSCLELYAGVPGAFVDLAADLSFALAVPLSELALDGRLTPPDDDIGVVGLADHSAINQAVGVLIGRGHTHDSAFGELRRLTAAHGVTLALAAELVLGTLASGPDDPIASPAG